MLYVLRKPVKILEKTYLLKMLRMLKKSVRILEKVYFLKKVLEATQEENVSLDHPTRL